MIRNTTPEDLEKIEAIYARARQFMKETGNPNQWKDSSPERALLLGDLEHQTGYVIEENGEIIGAFAFILGEDPTYGYIEDGAWLSNEPYGTIHRIAGDGIHKDTLKKAVAFAKTKISHLRIDTHHDNKVMQHTILKNGFERVGIIYLENGDPRIAYEML